MTKYNISFNDLNNDVKKLIFKKRYDLMKDDKYKRNFKSVLNHINYMTRTLRDWHFDNSDYDDDDWDDDDYKNYNDEYNEMSLGYLFKYDKNDFNQLLDLTDIHKLDRL